MYDRPEDRLKQMVMPRLDQLSGRPPRRYFRDFAALNGVSFDVRRGETVGIIGRNGSGKSTMLQIICGTLQPTGGSVEVDGRVAALLELGAGFNPEFTGRENVYLNAAILGLTRAETDSRFDDIARFADIGAFIEQPVKTYSSGMYVRLAFAVAINVDPEILVVDEALAVGDEAFQRKCFARIEDIRDRGGTILFVSHGAQTIVQLCDRALLFDRGEMILQGRPKTVVGQYQRLANASEEMAAKVRAQILAMREAPHANRALIEGAAAGIEPDGEAGVEALSIGRQPIVEAAAALQDDGLADFFDSNLVSQSRVELEQRGAHIRDVRIAALDGRPVNVLRMGKRYVFEYWADFSMTASNVAFGMFIRTPTGADLAGANTENDHAFRMDVTEPPTTRHVRFFFDCILSPGTYFFTCGVTGKSGGEAVVMHRIRDSVMFRVAPESGLISTGHFDIGCEFSIEMNKA
ncbi:MAG: ABC transporter ATP-binding protein [Nitratireductor sp.]|nr:ABC transporter ATP-binding protein [Nitratireductor sp.]